MKQSKKKIRKTNIKRRTKKTNYRKIQRGGMLSSGDKYVISDFMQSLSQSETVSIMFPYDNIHMDIAFPIKSLDQYINKNYQGLRNDELKTVSLGETDLDFNDIPNVPNFITNPYDISELSFPTLQIIQRNKFDRKEGILVPISNSEGELIPRTVIYLIKTMRQLSRESQGLTIYLDGVKQPKITHASSSVESIVGSAFNFTKDPTKPNEINSINVNFIDGQQVLKLTIYGKTEPILLYPISPNSFSNKSSPEVTATVVPGNVGTEETVKIEVVSDGIKTYTLNMLIPPYYNTCTFYTSLLTKIKTNFIMNISATSESSQSITEKDWNTYFYRIINSFLADDPYLLYFDTFVRQIMNPIKGNNEPIVSYKQAAIDDNEARADTEPLKPDYHINHYDDKIQRFLKLPKITNTGSNLLQYITNKVTVFIYTQNSKIIIQVYTVYYIVIGNIQAKGKGNLTSFFLGDRQRAPNYYQVVIGCVVLIKTVDIITGTVEYDYEIRWLLNQHTINNMAYNDITMKGFFGNNTRDILLEEDSKYGFNGPKNTHNYNNSNLPGNQIPVATLTEPMKTFDDTLTVGVSSQSKQSFTDPGSGVQLGSTQSSPGKPTAAAGIEEGGEEGEWQYQTNEYEPQEGDVNVGGRKKNKTRKRSIKRSNKRKTKY